MTSGRITLVGTDPARGFLVGDHSVGATSLTIDNGVSFSTGVESVLLDGAPYTVESLTFPTAQDEPATLVVSPGVAAALPDGEPVNTNPPMEVTYALVAVVGDEETTKVLVPQEMQDSVSLEIGPRGTVAEQEAVEFEDLGRGPELTWVEGRLQRDGAYIDPTTLPTLLPVQPTTSPVPTVDGFAGVILSRWVGVVNETPVMYEVHVSTSNASPHGVSTLLDVTAATAHSIRTLPDGSALAYDTTYYVAVVAKSGDLAAAPSVWVAGQMDRTRNSDLAADAIDGMTVTGATLRTASAGAREQITTADGYQSFDSAGVVQTQIKGGKLTTRDGEFTGVVVATGGEFKGNMTVSNTGNVFIVDNGQLMNWGTATYTQVQKGEVTVGTLSGTDLTFPKLRVLPSKIMFERSGSLVPKIESYSNGNLMYDAAAKAFVRGATDVDIVAFAGDVELIATGQIKSRTIGTTTGASSANVVVHPTNYNMFRSTSSARYKTDIGPFDPDTKRVSILDLEPILYRDKGEVQRHDDDPDTEPEPRQYMGLLAEDVHDAGWTEVVAYDGDGKPDNLMYDRMVAPLIIETRALRDRVAAQDDLIAALTARLDALDTPSQ